MRGLFVMGDGVRALRLGKLDLDQILELLVRRG